MNLRTLLIALAISACSPLSDEAKRLTHEQICANAPETRALIREMLVLEPGMVDLACLIVGK